MHDHDWSFFLRIMVAMEGNMNNITPVAKKPTMKEVDDAFDALAAFLFEQYRKHKEEVADKIDD